MLSCSSRLFCKNALHALVQSFGWTVATLRRIFLAKKPEGQGPARNERFFREHLEGVNYDVNYDVNFLHLTMFPWGKIKIASTHLNHGDLTWYIATELGRRQGAGKMEEYARL